MSAFLTGHIYIWLLWWCRIQPDICCEGDRFTKSHHSAVHCTDSQYTVWWWVHCTDSQCSIWWWVYCQTASALYNDEYTVQTTSALYDDEYTVQTTSALYDGECSEQTASTLYIGEYTVQTASTLWLPVLRIWHMEVWKSLLGKGVTRKVAKSVACFAESANLSEWRSALAVAVLQGQPTDLSNVRTLHILFQAVPSTVLTVDKYNVQLWTEWGLIYCMSVQPPEVSVQYLMTWVQHLMTNCNMSWLGCNVPWLECTWCLVCCHRFTWILHLSFVQTSANISGPFAGVTYRIQVLTAIHQFPVQLAFTSVLQHVLYEWAVVVCCARPVSCCCSVVLYQ